MLNVKILKLRIELGEEVKSVKLWLSHKEVVEYNCWKALPENAKSRDSLDKVVSRLKQDDDTWLERESELLDLESTYNRVNTIYTVLMQTLEVMSKQDYSIAQFQELQTIYLEELI